MKSINNICCFLSFLLALVLVRQSSAADLSSAQNRVAVMSQIVINEFLALNDSLNADEDGDYSDWIELYNIGPTSVDLTGWYITDDPAVRNGWQFPSLELGAQDHLLIWASGKDRRTGDFLHTNFKLKNEGEFVGLYDPTQAVMDTITFGLQTTNVSLARIPDGSGTFKLTNYPTPGETNRDKDTSQNSITLTSPNGGESWVVGSNHDITWSVSESVASVILEFSSDNGGNWNTIVSSTQNDGLYSWLLPDALSNGCLVRIIDATDRDPSDVSDGVFSLVARANVERFAVFELVLSTNKTYENPYQQVSVQATFLCPNGSKTIPGFWDGGNTWRIRFSPDIIGDWTFSTTSNDPDLITNGGFTCVSSTRKGGIMAMGQHPLHFQYQDGTPFWWFGETCWAAFSSNVSEALNSQTFQEYIDVRAGQGFNYLHGDLLFGANEGGAPFVGGVGNQVNPSFWQEVDRRVQYMNNKSMTVGLVLAWKYDDEDTSSNWIDFSDQQSRKNYCQYIAARYSAYNGVWILSGEYDEAPSLDPNSDAEWRELAYAVRDNDPHDRMMAIHGTELVENFADENWMSFGDYMQYDGDLHSGILDARDHAKPVVNAEDNGYFLEDKDGDGVPDSKYGNNLEDFRHALWDIAMAGGYFVTGFQSTYLGGMCDPGTFNVNDSKNDPAEDQISNIITFFSAVKWWEFLPSDSLVTGPGIHYCLSDFVGSYLVYVRGTTNTVQLNLVEVTTHEYAICCFDPRTGSWTDLPVQVSSTAVQLTTLDDQDWAFVIQKRPSTLTVTSPNGSEKWIVGSNHDITWSPGTGIDQVRLELSTDNSSNWTIIAVSTANDGSYNWTIPAVISNSCLIRISTTLNGVLLDVSDDVFSIVTPLPASLTITSPNGGERWVVNSLRNLKWNWTGIIVKVKLEYTTTGGANWVVIDDTTTNDGDKMWKVANTVSSTCQVRVSAVGDTTVNDASDSDFSIVGESPYNGNVVINEFLATNDSLNADEDGDYEDWLELYNLNTVMVDLSGYYLTDEPMNPYKWQLPTVLLGSHEYLLIWASNKNRTGVDSLHTNFKLNAAGDFLGLFDPLGAALDTLTFGTQTANVSLARIPDGSGAFQTTDVPTPAAKNHSQSVSVELAYFTVSRIDGNQVVLEWRIGSETSVNGFYIERRFQNQEFSQIGFIRGRNTTANPKVYTFVDCVPEEGVYSYRLKQVDFDGTFKYSSEMMADVLLPRVFTIEPNYPNPFNGTTTISFYCPSNSYSEVRIYNLQGELLRTLFNGNLNMGQKRMNWDGTDQHGTVVASGIYFIRISVVEQTKLIKAIYLK